MPKCHRAGCKNEGVHHVRLHIRFGRFGELWYCDKHKDDAKQYEDDNS